MHLIGEEGPLTGLIIDLTEKDEWILGRDPDVCDFALEDKTVSRKHLKFTKEDENVFLKNLSRTNPILINDNKTKGEVLLNDGDKIKIGQTTFLFSTEDVPKEFKENKVPSDQENIEGETIYQENLSDEEQKLKEKYAEQEKEIPEDILDETYDTIFKEEVDEEIPFDLTDNADIILKIISGPNSGAEIGMEKNKTYIIGKDPKVCDIIFNDISVSKQHAKIHTDSNNNVTIEDLNSKNNTLVNAEPITKKTTINTSDLISLGTTTFIIIDKEKEQETIYSPAVLEKPYSKKEEETEEEVQKELVDWKKRTIPTKHLVIAGSFIVIFFVIFLSFFSLFKSQNIEIANKDYKKEMKNALTKYEDVKYSYNPAGGTLFITGHVLTLVNKQELLYNIGQLAFIEKLEDTVIVDELVWQNTNDILTDNPKWRGISLHSPKAGEFVLSGYVQAVKDFEELTDYMNTNFSYLDRLKNNVVVEDFLKIQIATILQTKGFGNISYELASGELVLSGIYPKDQTTIFNDTVKEINKLKGIRDIKNLAVMGGQDSGSIDLSSKFNISGFATQNDKSYSVVANGKIITEGSILDGMQVMKITPNVVFLQKEGINYKINYSQ